MLRVVFFLGEKIMAHREKQRGQDGISISLAIVALPARRGMSREVNWDLTTKLDHIRTSTQYRKLPVHLLELSRLRNDIMIYLTYI